MEHLQQFMGMELHMCTTAAVCQLITTSSAWGQEIYNENSMPGILCLDQIVTMPKGTFRGTQHARGSHIHNGCP